MDTFKTTFVSFLARMDFINTLKKTGLALIRRELGILGGYIFSGNPGLPQRL
jgi:hypothetical protein